MKCKTVTTRLAGYLDGAMAGEVGTEERREIRAHLEACAVCRAELQRYRKLGALLSHLPHALPPRDLAIRIKVAAAQTRSPQDLRSRFQRMRDRAEILLDNVFRPLTLPATGGLLSALLVFVLVFQMIAPGMTVRAVENDVPLNLLVPAELVELSDYPQAWPEQQEAELSLPHGLMVDVTVDAHGQMANYQIIAGPDSPDLRRQLDQMLLFSRFRPMMSFGRPTSGGHVILSFSAVHIRG
jgi:hypothetical protein